MKSLRERRRRHSTRSVIVVVAKQTETCCSVVDYTNDCIGPMKPVRGDERTGRTSSKPQVTGAQEGQAVCERGLQVA